MLAAADVLVHPARYEPYGLGVHEAICRGVPAIVTVVCGRRRAIPEDARRPHRASDPPRAEPLMRALQAWRAEQAAWRERTAAFCRASSRRDPGTTWPPTSWRSSNDVSRVRRCRSLLGLRGDEARARARRDRSTCPSTRRRIRSWPPIPVRRCRSCGARDAGLPNRRRCRRSPRYFDRMYDQRWSEDWIVREHHAGYKDLIFADILDALTCAAGIGPPATARRRRARGPLPDARARSAGWQAEGLELNPEDGGVRAARPAARRCIRATCTRSPRPMRPTTRSR